MEEDFKGNKYLDLVLKGDVISLVGDNNNLDITYTIMKKLKDMGYEILYLEDRFLDDISGKVFIDNYRNIVKCISKYKGKVLLVINDDTVDLKSLCIYSKTKDIKIIKLSSKTIDKIANVVEIDFSKIPKSFLDKSKDSKIIRNNNGSKFKVDTSEELLVSIINNSWRNKKVN